MHGMNGSGIFSEPNFHSSCFAFKACPRLSYYLEKIWFKVILLEACAQKKTFVARSKTPGINPHCDGEIQGDCSHNSVRWVAACYLFKAGTVTLFDAYWFECSRMHVRDRWAERTPASMRPHTRGKHRVLWLSGRLFPSMCDGVFGLFFYGQSAAICVQQNKEFHRERREERAAEWDMCPCPQIAVASTDSTY